MHLAGNDLEWLAVKLKLTFRDPEVVLRVVIDRPCARPLSRNRRGGNSDRGKDPQERASEYHRQNVFVSMEFIQYFLPARFALPPIALARRAAADVAALTRRVPGDNLATTASDLQPLPTDTHFGRFGTWRITGILQTQHSRRGPA
jgi:hypothetical protein